MRLVGNGAMEFVWQGLCSIAGGYVRRAYNSAQWDEVPCAFVPAAMRRPRACSSRHSGLVTALCAAVGIAFLLAPPPAFAQSTTLVSNLDRLSTLAPAAGIYAQGFRTGAHTAGYTIRNVQVRLAAGSVTSSTKTSVLIRQERNGEPGALVTALTTQMPLVDGVNTFAAPANTTLNPQTNYFITVNEATPTRTCYQRPLTLTSAQTIFCEYEGTPVDQRAVYVRAVYEFTGRREQSGADGWSIDDKRLYKNYLSQDWDTSDRIFLFISVNGDVHTPNIEQQVEIVPPTVDGTPSVSEAGTDAQWSVGETVGVTVTFSEAVDVDTSGGTPSIGIGLGGTAARSATYASGTGTTELVFEYTLVSGDGSHGYMAVTPDSLALNGGTIRSAGSGVDALLAHNGALTSGNPERSTGPEASFQDVPKSHDGATAFTVGLQFSGEPAGLSATRDAASVLEVTGGSVTGARVTSQSANPAWEVTVAPDGLGEVTIEVPVRACTEANAVCIGGRSLSRAVETTVPGTRMTARFTQTPSAHDGSNGFELHMEFSHEPENFSYRTVQGALFDIEGGRIERVWRRERGKGRQWGIVVAPDGGGAVTLAARATTDCAAQHAVCDAEGWKFAGDLSLTVPGPASSSLPVVSIAASTTPVTEGTAAAFTLSRTGATDAALTVEVSVSESKASVSGTPPTSVTFAAASDSATLSVATEDDEVAEDASTVTATVSSGTGYTVSGTSGSADVVVEEDDAAPAVATASPIVVAENATSVATLSATDADTAAEDLSWSIPAGAAGGADAAKFALTTAGVLTFKAAKDYESPDDTDTDGDYEITVRVTDGVNPVDAALVVRLSDVDDVAPVLSSASVDGAVLTLTFGEVLDTASQPAASSFAVSVAGSARTVDAVAVSEKVVTLTLSSAVTSGQTVTVDYTVPTGAGAKPVQDAAGNPAASFANTNATNATDALPVVLIAPAATPVTEGAAAAFTLARTGATAAALTVAVSVSESEAAVSGTPPTSVTFAAGSASATLSVATVDDEAVEEASTVTATVSPGTGYTVSGTSGSAEVVVEDDDAAPAVATASPIVVAENATSVATLSATDADTAAADLSWSIPAGAAGGADAAQFALTADGALSFKAAKDYEAPDDADADGAYEVTVRVTDGVNPVDAALVVRLEDADDDTGPTASFEALPERHDGTAAFRFELHFSEEPSGLSYRTVGGGLLEVTGGTLTHARRLTRGRNQGWEVTVVPTQAGDIVITLPARSCGEADAICIDGAPLARAATATVPGPASSSLPVVSIVTSATPVTEGTAAAFTLSRTGATDAALTVTVSVSESEASVSGTPPTSVTFAAASASATLSVATEDDEVAEDASTVTATVSSGSGYTVSGTSGSADVVVEEDDATPVVTTASPIVVAENATAVATLTATDADTAAADLAWSIPAGAAGGADGAKFALTADGVLSFRAAKDYEAPDDTDTDGAYEVTVRVTDGSNPVDAALVVRLSDVDDVAPVLSSASVDGAVLTLTFVEALDTASQPAASSFAVSVAGSARTVVSAAVSGSTVVLTLSSAVTSGQTVTVGYTVPTGAGAKPVQDAAGNPAVAVANTNAINTTAAALPEVSIAPASTPVTEGTAAAFVLTRTGATAAELTVTVQVSEAGSVLYGTPPSSATFASGSAETRLSVATENDAADEADARVSASIVAGDGYEVDAERASAGVDVFDDDAAAQAAAVEELWSTTLTWADLGNNWFGGFADGFSNPGWSEDGQAFRIWYITYDAEARTLSMAHDGSGGLIAEPGQLALHVGGLEVGPGAALSAFAGARVGRVGGVDAQWNVGGQVTVRLTRASGDADAAPAGPRFSVADATAEEGTDRALAFVVTLSRPHDASTTVQYATSDGQAVQGANYEETTGTLTFAARETQKIIRVPVIDDDLDDTGETLTLTLSSPTPSTYVRIADAEAIGTITNSDPLPRALMARFGRTAAVHVVAQVEARLQAPRGLGVRGRVAGRELRPGMERDLALGVLSQLGASVGANPLDAGIPDPMAGSSVAGAGSLGMPGRGGRGAMATSDGGLTGRGLLERGLGGGNLLTGSAFVMNRETGRGGILSVWSRGAQSQFAGREGELSLDGRVRTAMVGADYAAGPLVAGLSLSHSRGRGGYSGVDIGEVTSSVTGLYPWLGYKMTDRISLWGVTGYGSGALTLTPGAGAALQSGLSMAMAAGGMRGELADSVVAGFGLAFKADALWVGTGVEGVDGPEGRLAATEGAVTRFRTALEASRGYRFQRGLSLQPRLEVGLRRDGGDAETGAGVDIGGGLVVSDALTGLSADVRVRMLLAHQDAGFSERGLSVSFGFDPAPSTPFGFMAKVTPSWGGQATGGAQALWGQETMAGMPQGGVASGPRLEAELGYGLPVWGRLVGTPRFGIGTSESGRDYRLAYGLTLFESGAMHFELGVDAHRRESPAEGGAEHGVQGRLTARW